MNEERAGAEEEARAAFRQNEIGVPELMERLARIRAQFPGKDYPGPKLLRPRILRHPRPDPDALAASIVAELSPPGRANMLEELLKAYIHLVRDSEE